MAWDPFSRTGPGPPPLTHCVILVKQLALSHLLHKTVKVTVVVRSVNHVQLFATPWTTAHQASLPFTISKGLPKLMSIELVIPSNHLVLCHPLLLLPSIFPSIRVFPNELVLCIWWPKHWSFSFSISPSREQYELTVSTSRSHCGKQQKICANGSAVLESGPSFQALGREPVLTPMPPPWPYTWRIQRECANVR